MDDNDREKLVAQSWLAEFEGLRNAILTHARIMYALMGVSVSALGTLLAISLPSGRLSLLLILSYISSLLGMAFVAEGLMLSDEGHYIDKIIAPALRVVSRELRVMGWETWIREQRKQNKILNSLTLPIVLGGIVFLFPCVAGLVAPWFDTVSWDTPCWLGWSCPFRVAWVIAAILTLTLFVQGIYASRYWSSR